MSAIAALEAIANVVAELAKRLDAVEAANQLLLVKVAEHDKKLETPLPPGTDSGAEK
jgi:hypothetical protein